MIYCWETPPVNKFLTTPKKITKKNLAHQAIKPDFYTKKATITPTVKKITAKTPQVKNKGNGKNKEKGNNLV